MNPPVNLIGQRFGQLVVVAQRPSLEGKRRWECICDCGGKVESTTNRLRAGYRISCGCAPSGQAAAKIKRGVRQEQPSKRLVPPSPPPKAAPPAPCRSCLNWTACANAELGGQCTAGLFRAGNPVSGSCRFQVRKEVAS